MTFDEQMLYSKLATSFTSNLMIIDYIRSSKIDINVRFNNDNFFNLLAACFVPSIDLNRVELIKYLLKNGIDINAYVIDQNGYKRNALWNACFKGDKEGIKLLVAAGIDLTDGLLSAKAYTRRFADILKTHPNITKYATDIVHYEAFEILPDEVTDVFIF